MFLINLKLKKCVIKHVDKYPKVLEYVPDHLKTQEMSDNDFDKYPSCLLCVPEQFTCKEMCDKAVVCDE